MFQKTVTLDNSDLLVLRGTKSDAPQTTRKQFSDPNVPLDSDL